MPQGMPTAPVTHVVVKLAALAVALLALVGQAQTLDAPAVIRVGVARGSSYDIVSLPLETYVSRVLAGEAAQGSAPAALEALAITVRTFALANLGRHRADGFDLCDQTHCQVLRAATATTERAALATAGQVLLYRGAPASVFYSASCGGHTERPSEVWPGAEDPPYLPSRTDDACQGEPAWTDEISAADLGRALAAAGFSGTLKEMRIAGHDSSGRVSRLSLDGLKPSEISGQDLRAAVGRTLGWQHVKSADFELRRAGSLYRLNGYGSGHGVGLCVIGSVKLAAAGDTAPKILSRYFPGLTIGRVSGARISAAPSTPPPPHIAAAPSPVIAPVPPVANVPNVANVSGREINVALPDGDEGEQPTLTALALRERDDVAKALGVEGPRPGSIVLRFHATTAEYEQATGQAWFTSASVVKADVHFVPLASLRDRGVLERTIRRELVHVMADPVLAQRPAWVREGAALFYADTARDAEAATNSRAACPADAELLHPVSAGALADAYARARNCFARQIAAGRSWRDVK
jgi:SpoIID/LytB domain protein